MRAKTIDQIVEILQAPTPEVHIEFTPKKIRENDDGTYSALAIPYVSIDYIRMRLNDACGPFEWQLEAKEVNQLTFAGIGIKHPETSEWIFKWDTGQDEPTVETAEDYSEGHRMGSRGVFSLCVKRAAYQWGLGLDVRALPPRYNRCEVYRRGNKTYFRRWITSPLSNLRKELEQRTEAGPAEKKVSEITKAKEQCWEYAHKNCSMARTQFDKFCELHVKARGETIEAYRDVWNELVAYRREMTDVEEAQGYTPKFMDVLAKLRGQRV